MDKVISDRYGDSLSNFGDMRFLVDYTKFRDNFYSTLDKKKHPLHPATVWTQIRSCIKGSCETYLYARSMHQGGGPRRYGLPLEQYLEFAAKRSRIALADREEVHNVFLLYNDWLEKVGMWDDDDRALELLLRSQMDVTLDYTKRDVGPYDKIYVDEVQDSTEVEIILFCLAAGMNFERLYLAGDPAQAIVEGVDFRFEEIRSMVHKLTEGRVRVEKTVRRIVRCIFS